ncbi:MAG TPA: SDR family NAD(P)-dependent oxidoreductase [Steroidobacteraceae bacterium]|nr:SDR family NAD(P)-dependent oxidoreductase [Steroidobacteraceae bacterium]
MSAASTPAASRVAVVTGGLGALGKAVVEGFIAAGYRVAVIDRLPADAPAAAASRTNPGVLLLAGVDLGDATAAQEAMRAAAAHFGGIDALINVAGAFRWQLLSEGDLAIWHGMFAANLLSAASACRAAIPYLRQRASGRIVNIGAGAAAARAAAGMGAYAASKAGVHKLTESLADELKSHGITVNAVLPGTIDTPQNRADMPDADRSRWVTPREVASVILFLASDAAQAVTGALVPVNGRG